MLIKLLLAATVSTSLLAEGPPPVAPSDWFFDQYLRFRWHQAKVHHDAKLRGVELQQLTRDCKEVADEYNKRAKEFSPQLLKNRRLPLALVAGECD